MDGATGGVAVAGCFLRASSVELGRFPDRLEIGAFLHDAWFRGTGGLQLDGLVADVRLAPAKEGVGLVSAPALTWSNLEYRGVHLMPEGFALAMTDQTATAQMKVGVKEADLHAVMDIHADWSHAWQVAVTAEVPPSTLADTEALRGAIRRLTGMELNVTGQVAATVSAWLEQDHAPAVKVAAAVGNLDIGCPAEKWQVTGLSAGMTADGPRAWRTPQGQALTFQSARSGEFAFDSGALRWQYRREALLLEQADVNWCGGSLHAFGVPYDPHERRLETVLYAERIELGRLMAQTRVLQGSGEGRLFGRIPVKVDKGKVELAESYLYSTPGETGILKLSNTGPLDLAMAQANIDAETRRQFGEAMKNLQYTLIRMDLSGGGTNSTLGVQIKGHSADNPALRPVDLNVNMNGSMDEIFNFGMHYARKLQ